MQQAIKLIQEEDLKGNLWHKYWLLLISLKLSNFCISSLFPKARGGEAIERGHFPLNFHVNYCRKSLILFKG